MFKKFKLIDNLGFLNMEKLVIIIVLSWESDVKRDNVNFKDRIVILIGEVISVERLEDGSVKI